MPASRPLVTVTGATGFIASHLVRLLLERGYRVRGTVRNLANAAALAHLRAMPGAERLDLVEADLRTPGAFDEAVRGAACVMHTASPYLLTVNDPQRDLVDPAVDGTRTVLAACVASPSVRRVVVTSSMAAITDEPDAAHVLTEADWNTRSSLTRNPYYLSKAMAERAAWTFLDEHRPAFDLVVVNPFMVIGPSLSPGLNVSTKVFADILAGVYPVVMDLTFGFVDVRDVALAHVLAMEVASASGRYVCAAETVPFREVVDLLRASGYGAYKLPRLRLDSGIGSAIIRGLSYFQPKGEGSYLRTHVGHGLRFDNSRIRRELGLTFRDVRTSIVETLDDLTRWGHVAPR